MSTDDIVAIYKRVLETDNVSADSDFFLLGGDSLLGTRILSAVARAQNVELTFEDLLDAPTPGGLAKKIAGVAR